MAQDRLLGKFSATVEKIYAASLAPALWPSAVESIADLHGSPKANLLTPTTAPSQGGFSFPVGIAESAVQLWATRYVGDDIWARQVVQRGLAEQGNVILGTELVTDDELENSPFYQQLLKPQGIWHLCTGIVFDGRKACIPLTAMSLFKSKRSTGFSDVDRSMYRLTLNHLSRSLGTMFLLRDAELHVQATLSALHRFSAAVVLIGERGNVVFANRAAMKMLGAQDGLQLRSGNPLKDGAGWLSAASSSEHARLAKELKASVDSGALDIDHFGNGIEISRTSAKRPYLVQVSSLPIENEFYRGERRALAIAFITDGSADPKLDRRLLKLTYGLTDAEIDLAQQLLRADTLVSAAMRLRITENTAKTHLRSVFEKTDTHRQTQLVRPSPGVMFDRTSLIVRFLGRKRTCGYPLPGPPEGRGRTAKKKTAAPRPTV